MDKLFLRSTVAIALSAGVSTAANATSGLVGGETLDFASGVYSCVLGGIYPNCDSGLTTVVTGTYFAMDNNSNGLADSGERVAMVSAGTGLILDSVTGQGIGEIDNAWDFYPYLGLHVTDQGLTPSVNPDGTVNMSGWTVYWGAPGEETYIDMGTGGAATVTCGDVCQDGDTFNLTYITRTGPPEIFGGVNYLLYMEGVVSVVPVPAAVWLFGSGLLGLLAAARRKRM